MIRKLQVFENIGSGHHQTSGDEIEKKEKSIWEERECFSIQISTAEISSKRSIPVSPLFQDNQTIPKKNNRES